MTREEQEFHVGWLTYHERDVSKLWGELRALLALPDTSPEAFLDLCAHAFLLDAARYRGEWLPYLAGRVEELPPLVAFDGWDDESSFGHLYPAGARVVPGCDVCGLPRNECGGGGGC